jgi:hypothetical protein
MLTTYEVVRRESSCVYCVLRTRDADELADDVQLLELSVSSSSSSVNFCILTLRCFSSAKSTS